jgi:hypothetical protein
VAWWWKEQWHDTTVDCEGAVQQACKAACKTADRTTGRQHDDVVEMGLRVTSQDIHDRGPHGKQAGNRQVLCLGVYARDSVTC